MNDLAPRQQFHAEPPLSAGARFIRGFKRLGIVFGVIAFLVGIFISLMTAGEQNQKTLGRHAQAVCFLDAQHARHVVMNQYRTAEVDLAGSGCPGPIYSEPVSTILDLASRTPAPFEGFVEPLSIGALISVAAGLSLFAVFWLLGWLCAGFTRDN
jgi:hypothetical protein